MAGRLARRARVRGAGARHADLDGDAATLRRLVAASGRCLPATMAKGPSRGGGIAYVASLQHIEKGSAGKRNYSLSFMPQVANLLDGLELDLAGRPVAGGSSPMSPSRILS